ncbi:MAG: HAMP domain-containing sensor histidine kinase [Alphaproteobacteria bacterium]|nr:HAMP domain-containing sensor histidine kinase [Alphaproteobacteria bacterium]MCY4231518.1 HAMP domain-containing sensor histidine kinase [Alphaproteobacteria bacterium]MCY4317784.1 HAMP domain-containing sensor histidine kinase [Alphaproteobacteria bacterium]
MRLTRSFRSLSARLLVLTVFFVMLAELLIYAPSIARFRLAYLADRLADAHIAALALEAAPSRAVDEALETRLLRHVSAYSVELRVGERMTYMLGGTMPPDVDAAFDLDEAMAVSSIWDAAVALVQTRNRVLQVRGASPREPGARVEVTMDEGPMREAMFAYSERILLLSLVISALTAAAVFLALHGLMVRPMSRLTEAMTRFGADPEDQSRIHAPSGRSDEIGAAERQLSGMQRRLHAALSHRAHLAAVGEGVAKINHDLRNMLASAQLVSDSLGESRDPRVRKAVPTLVGALDRAVALCTRVVDFARAGGPRLTLEPVLLADLIDDAACTAGRDTAWANEVGPGITVEGDREQLFRVFANLARNATEAGARTVSATARLREGRVHVTVADNGPGLSERARKHLFRPFQGSTRPDGSGLGLAIAREIMRAHGGSIRLVSSGGEGTVFRLDFAMGREV